MIGAVDQGHRDVDHRKSERTARHRVARAGFDGRKILPRHRSAVHALGEGEALAAAARADLDHDVAELAMAARLFFVPSAHRDRVANRFPIGDRRFVRLDGYAEAVGEPLGGHAQVHFALSEQLQFRHLGVLDIGERAILFAKLGQARSRA